jgi:hypothetical protein
MPFNFFKAKSAEQKITDLIWIHAAAKQKGFIGLITKYPDAVIAGWFNDSISVFQRVLHSEHRENEVRNIRQLVSPQVENKQVLLLEHYPLYSKEEQIWEHWKPAGISILNSLDEPLFNYFGGENIAVLMEKMGLKENETIEHPMVSKALRNAQQKLEKQVLNEHSADSQEEWFRRNFPAKQ